MGKSNGGTRVSSSNSPKGLRLTGNIENREGVEWVGYNGIYSANTEYGRVGVSYSPIDDEYNVYINGRIYEDYASRDLATAQSNAIKLMTTDGLVEHMRDMDAFDVRGTYVQMSKTEYGNRAIRVLMASPSTKDYQAQNKELVNISNWLNKRFGIRTNVFVDTVRGQKIGYIEYPWKD